MRRKRRNDANESENGFGAWGGYMEAKKAKLVEQFNTATLNQVKKQSDIFCDIKIFVNGRTVPSAEELKVLMAAHGGEYHTYQSSKTTHIIASNLPNVKIKQLGSVPIVKPDWITNSIEAGKVLDYKNYLLYTNQSKTQPRLNFTSTSEPKPKQTLTAADPRFLGEFYSNSRLHLISTLGAELKQLVRQMREKKNWQFTGKQKLIETFAEKKNSFNIPQRVIMHIDMDCFFVSVGLRKRPDLKGKPVAVTHAKNNAKSAESKESYAEIASCSYEARKCGIRNGMFLGDALELCPQINTIPYDFEDYKEVSMSLYRIISSYTLEIEAVSCDEMYVDVSQILKETGLNVEEWAKHIRSEITEETGCPCSTGFGANRLQARLATKRAKPNGQFYLREEEVEEFMGEMSVADLPGVGYATVQKLNKLGLKTCCDVLKTPLSVLQSELGKKGGETIHDQAKGIDKRPLNFDHERKSVSADVNYGIRFNTQEEALNFLESLSTEVHTRLVETGMRARCLTLKLLVRAKDAPVETKKFLGCGECDSITKSTTSGALVSEASSIFREAKALFERVNTPCTELRGVGIQLTKLEKCPPVNTALSNFLKCPSTSKGVTKETVVENDVQNKESVGSKKGGGSGRGIKRYVTPPSHNLERYFGRNEVKNEVIDLAVVNELPEDIKNEIMETYKLNSRASTPRNFDECSNSTCTDLNIENKSAFHQLTPEQVKDALRSWVSSQKEPKNCDVSMLAQFFKELALDRKIECLDPMFRFLHRNISKKKCGKWHRAYFEIVNTTQEGMVMRYGNTLLVPAGFSCCTN